MSELAELIQRVDTSEPSLYVVKLNVVVPFEKIQDIGKQLVHKLNEFAPGSEVIILGPEFDFVSMPSDEVMRSHGWVKTGEDDEQKK